ncbi:DUF554 domain-containing protein [Anaerotignum lactatifermentans]|uniref:DUF554 domain-containing protein n=1 Tax=Anaerotignum lactatifermentans TaxID=160404 RepID=A0ABS2G6E2_9FIRM|nr:DUF554 domain-containing protein [Anaerotignum lactatifermentans]MBM6828806.1 DUF554 domain-containing protein [Anaerotignum lactatifermentans]MBM6877021.1 DUF554 domain-containing protein [Anaerotignum lactatifermentans]MBM6950578.1 DUF554 domain-containing protein [Anaerotignum lactatifermentans]
MPIGVLVNGGSVVLGGILGCVLGKKLNQEFQEKLQMVFAVCSMAMGITTIVLMQNMPAVVLAMILGTVLGHFCRLDHGIHKAAGGMQKAVFGIVGSGRKSSPEEMDILLTVIVLFCASGTGIYGSIISGMTGDHSILMAKSVLDLFTAAIFACSLGLAVSLIAVPQMVLFLLLFFCAGIIYPLCSPEMIADFKACGGCIMLATGFRMVRLKMFPVADMIPAMILVMPVSWIWMTYILPLVS